MRSLGVGVGVVSGSLFSSELSSPAMAPAILMAASISEHLRFFDPLSPTLAELGLALNLALVVFSFSRLAFVAELGEVGVLDLLELRDLSSNGFWDGLGSSSRNHPVSRFRSTISVYMLMNTLDFCFLGLAPCERAGLRPRLCSADLHGALAMGSVSALGGAL